ncbi:MAG: hypothetical protein M9935_08550 [Kiritimatiellae bacterium]|nr:hypothetical protein [Kiritimatiellia bacterium]
MRRATHLRQRIAEAAGVTPDCVYLFSCGMAAIYTLYRSRPTPQTSL